MVVLPRTKSCCVGKAEGAPLDGPSHARTLSSRAILDLNDRVQRKRGDPKTSLFPYSNSEASSTVLIWESLGRATKTQVSLETGEERLARFMGKKKKVENSPSLPAKLRSTQHLGQYSETIALR